MSLFKLPPLIFSIPPTLDELGPDDFEYDERFDDDEDDFDEDDLDEDDEEGEEDEEGWQVRRRRR